LGKALLRLETAGACPLPDLEKRLDAFQPREGDRWINSDRLYFALTLRAPLQWHDPSGRLLLHPDREVLRAYAGSVPEDIEFLGRASALETEVCSGWSPAWGLPKPVVQALAAGNVLAFRAPATQRQAILDFLAEAERDGLGERRTEGLGEVVACDPFHITFDSDRAVEEKHHG
jgi:CRISPR-associated protein Csx10